MRQRRFVKAISSHSVKLIGLFRAPRCLELQDYSAIDSESTPAPSSSPALSSPTPHTQRFRHPFTARSFIIPLPNTPSPPRTPVDTVSYDRDDAAIGSVDKLYSR